MMKTIKNTLVHATTIFTFILLILTLLSSLSTTLALPLQAFVPMLFLMALLTSAFVEFAQHFITRTWLCMLVELLGCTTIVYLLGICMGWFSLGFIDFLVMLGVVGAVYGLTRVFYVVQAKLDADELNQSLEKIKHKQ